MSIRSRDTSTGYGPSASGSSKPIFDGDEAKFERWEQRFLGYLKLRKLKDVISAEEPGEEEEWIEKNENVYAELIQLIDDTSLSLVMRDAENDGRKAMKILREHYTNVSKPRVIALYMELTSLAKSHSETTTDYMIRAETAAAALKASGEEVSDSLLVAMTLKGLPDDYKPFVVVINQKESVTFEEFKRHLRNFEEAERVRNANTSTDDDTVMKSKSSNANKDITCYKCGKKGHIAQRYYML